MSDILYSLLIFLILYILYRLSTINHTYWKDRGIPHMKPWPIFGTQIREFLGLSSPVHEMMRAYKLYPKERVIGLLLYSRPLLMIRDPDLVKQITVQKFDHFTDHTPVTIHPETDPMFSRNLFSLNGNEWKQMRSIVSPTFTSSKIRGMLNLIQKCCTQMVNQLTIECQKQTDDILEIDMQDMYTYLVIDSIASVSFGMNIDSFKDKNNEFYSMCRELTSLSFVRSILLAVVPKIMYFLGQGFTSNKIKDYFTNIIYDNMKIRKEKGIIRPDLIYLMMQARDGSLESDLKNTIETGYTTVIEHKLDTGNKKPLKLTNNDIVAQSIFFLFAGYKSTAGTMAFMSYELAINVDVQKKLQKDIDDVLKECNGKVTYEALFSMKYFDMVVSESLRKWPPGFDHERICTKNVNLEMPGREITIEKGIAVLLPSFAFHRDHIYFPNPQKFDPERFNDENKSKIETYAYLPFGMGPRACLGSRLALLMLKLGLFNLLANFDFEVINKTDIPLKLKHNPFKLQARNGIWVGLKLRNKN